MHPVPSRPTSLPTSRTQLAALVAARTGFLRAIRQTRANRGLVAFAYHRVGDPALCPVDSGLMTVSRRELTRHALLLQRSVRLVTLAEVEDRVRTGRGFDEPMALLTFDDAYRDSYTDALPALQAANATAVFFVATGLIESAVIPWWDRIAYTVKTTEVDSIDLPYPQGLKLEGIRENRSQVLRMLLRRYKSDAEMSKPRFLEALEQSLGAAARSDRDLGRLFCTWDELRMLRDAGMEIAAHTHSHELLSHLPLAQQREELVRCRETLRQKLGITPRTLAYPVGSTRAFNDETRRALRETGYQMAFSHYGGWNRGVPDPFDLRRVPVDEDNTAHIIHAAVSVPRIFA